MATARESKRSGWSRVSPCQLIKIEDQCNSFTLKNDIENISEDSNKQVTNNSVENCNIKSKYFINNGNPDSSDDEKCNQNNNSTNCTTEHVSKIAHMMFTQKFAQKII